MAVRERVSLPLPATSPSLPAAEVPVDLMADNRRLQELLHQALRREAEALRKLKHLSLQLAEFRATCRTPTPVETNGEAPGCREEEHCMASRRYSLQHGCDCVPMGPLLRSSCMPGGEPRGGQQRPQPGTVCIHPPVKRGTIHSVTVYTPLFSHRAPITRR